MKNTKKRNWLKTTLCVLAACAVLGTIVSGIMFAVNAGKACAYASVEFSFDGAADGIAPNGYAFTMADIESDEVLTEAIAAAGLSGRVTPDQVRQQLETTGVYPEGIVAQMTNYDSVLDFSANQQMTATSYHPTLYSVILYNGFEAKLSDGELKTLLNSILSSYRSYFAKKYAVGTNSIEISYYQTEDDYTQQLAVITQQLESSAAYAQELYAKHPTVKLSGKGFNDIAIRLNALIRNDVERLNANITVNRLTKNSGQLATLYRFRIKNLNTELTNTKTLLNQLDLLIAKYDRNGDVYVSTSSALTKIDSNSSETYDKLVTMREETAARITKINREIEEYEARLGDIEPTEAKTNPDDAESDETGDPQVDVPADPAPAIDPQEEIDALLKKREEVMTDFAELIKLYNEQQINDGTIVIVAAKYEAPRLLSGAFAKQTLKVAGPFCAVGFMVCLVLIIIARKKEEKK